jgi:hypothetical protein
MLCIENAYQRGDALYRSAAAMDTNPTDCSAASNAFDPSTVRASSSASAYPDRRFGRHRWTCITTARRRCASKLYDHHISKAPPRPPDFDGTPRAPRLREYCCSATRHA